jgi:hypothetical protein
VAEPEATEQAPAGVALVASIGGWLLDGLGWLVRNLLDSFG